MNILNYLDNEIEKFRQNKGDYPNLILMSKETQDKLITEINKDKETQENGSWENLPNNYKGISIKIRKDIFLKLEGE